MIHDVPVRLLSGGRSRRLEEEALNRAAAILCQAPGHGPEAKESCRDCRRTFRREHPDLIIAAPESRRRVHTPPFDQPAASKETTVPAALVRAVAAHSTQLPYEAGLRAVVFLDIDRTEEAAYSALLKVLEEPPQKTRFILTATKPRLLPPTILSRLVEERLLGLGRPGVTRALVSFGLSPEEAALRASFEPEDEREAVQLDLTALRAERDGILEAAMGTLLTHSRAWALALAARLDSPDPSAVSRKLRLFAELLRDAATADITPGLIIHQERAAELNRLGQPGKGGLISVSLSALDLANLISEARLNSRLALEAFTLSLIPQVSSR